MNVIINLNKPYGLTSHQVVSRVKRLLGANKAGHTGTLDPMATGVLLVCLNEATKISGFLLDMDKQYNARVKLGERTDTYDSHGRIIEQKDISFLTGSLLSETVKEFKGHIKQKPPMYSAVKVGGNALYKLARKGMEIERPERSVEIYDIRITGIDIPYFNLTVSCAKGTYIRTLCDDIGKKLGTGAHLVSLERSRVGPFDIKNSVSLDNIKSGEKSYYSIDYVLSGLREIILDDNEYRKAINGQPIISNKINQLANREFCRLKGAKGNLFAIGIVDNEIIRVKRILNL
ncbi:MAG: tRNA pseudouridine(55) synthase TruB [Nitrospirota bacterium]